MTDRVQKIREEVVGIINSINLFAPDEDGKNSSYEEGRLVVASQIIQIIDSLQEEPVSDLEEEINRYIEHLSPEDIKAAPFCSIEDCARHFAEWQKEQMMANATEVAIHIDAGGYPYTPEIELYDYDKDVPLAKEGDKYKVVLIKED